MSREEADALALAQQEEDARLKAQQTQQKTCQKLSALLDSLGGGAGKKDAGVGEVSRGLELEGAGRAGEIADGWDEVYDESGRVYYYCSSTGVTQWDKPVCGDADQAFGGGEGGGGGGRGETWEEQVVQYARYYGMSTEDADRWLRQQWGGAGHEWKETGEQRETKEGQRESNDPQEVDGDADLKELLDAAEEAEP
jgi:hypothetical protein